MKVGDLVILKSSGPVMTVAIIGSPEITTVWMPGVDIKFATFPSADCLTALEEITPCSTP